MAAAVSKFGRVDLGFDLLVLSGHHVPAFRGNVFLQHGANAEASTVQDSDHGACGIWRGARPDWAGAVHSTSAGSGGRHLLVRGQSCRVYVPLYLVSWHVPALPL